MNSTLAFDDELRAFSDGFLAPAAVPPSRRQYDVALPSDKCPLVLVLLSLSSCPCPPVLVLSSLSLSSIPFFLLNQTVGWG